MQSISIADHHFPCSPHYINHSPTLDFHLTWAENRRRIYCGYISLEIYVRTMSAQHLTKDICLTREMLCGHCADIYIQGYMSALYPSSLTAHQLNIMCGAKQFLGRLAQRTFKSGEEFLDVAPSEGRQVWRSDKIVPTALPWTMKVSESNSTHSKFTLNIREWELLEKNPSLIEFFP